MKGQCPKEDNYESYNRICPENKEDDDDFLL